MARFQRYDRDDERILRMLTAPQAQGLYDPQFEHDACGVGFIAHVKGQKSHGIIRDAIGALVKLNHRGACGCETNTVLSSSNRRSTVASRCSKFPRMVLGMSIFFRLRRPIVRAFRS